MLRKLQDVFSWDEMHNLASFFPEELKIIATQFYINMNKKFTQDERKKIAEEAIFFQDKSGVAFKYGINIKTLYKWISKAEDTNKRHESLCFRITEEENEKLREMFEKNGQHKNLSSYLREKIFSEFILEGDPEELPAELKQIRPEVNEVGKKVNRLANYTNYLKMNNKVSNDWIPDIRKFTEELKKISRRTNEALDKGIKKLPKN